MNTALTSFLGTTGILIFLLSLLVSFLFYHFFSKKKLGKVLKSILILLRAFVFYFITLLLFPWEITQEQTEQFRKKLIVLEDISKSTLQNRFFDWKPFLNKTKFRNKATSPEVVSLFFGEDISKDSTKTNGDFTNISHAINELNQRYHQDEIAGVVLVSDGIYNQGYHPKWLSPKPLFPVHTIGMGDTTKHPDRSISRLFANQLAFLGNDFPLEFDLKIQDYTKQAAHISVKNQKGKTIYSKKWKPKKEQDFFSEKIFIEAKEKGKQKYQVSIEILDGEKNIKNNIKNIQIEVIDASFKVLFVASEIHPDHLVLINSLKGNLDFKTDLVSKEFESIDLKKYDIISFLGFKKNTIPLFQKTLELKKPFLLKLSSHSDRQSLQKSAPEFVKPAQTTFITSQTEAALEKDFKKFEIPKIWNKKLDEFPPLLSPFIPIQTTAPTTTLLSQKAFGQKTNKPLISFSKNNQNAFAIIEGEGFWKWRMNYFQKEENHQDFDLLFQNIFRLLGIQKNKRKIYIQFPKRSFVNTENILEVLTYNDSYEAVNKDILELKITSPKGNKINQTLDKLDGKYQKNLIFEEIGIYTYHIIKNKKTIYSGTFESLKNDLELENLQADHQLLRLISKETNGLFFSFKNKKELIKFLESQDIRNESYTLTSAKSLFDFWEILLIILTLALLEWFIRRYFGLL
ncbi:MAG: hypothetical protein N4A45_11380 [Flavobacteriales bacterium]|jgi:hypothetical protein|nr:hypothetical protein [Flavobacteriales bacterium]